jgi:hypothetical protein
MLSVRGKRYCGKINEIATKCRDTGILIYKKTLESWIHFFPKLPDRVKGTLVNVPTGILMQLDLSKMHSGKQRTYKKLRHS